jgi:Alkylmercury lyase
VDTETFDRDVRLAVFVERGRPPTVAETSAALDSLPGEVEDTFRRLEAAHVLVFAPGTLNIWMAQPLSAFPTPFWVETPRGGYWGTCIWDAFGVVAMLADSGTVSTQCADCGTPMELRVRGGVLQASEGVAHFAVPARHWWDNIGYT